MTKEEILSKHTGKTGIYLTKGEHYGKDVLEAMEEYAQHKLASDGDLSDVRASAIQVAKDLAEWSAKYPRGRIYGMNRKDDMDGQLIKLEERAKELFPHLP